MDAVDQVIERLWGGRAPQREVLGGGITNHNVKVTLDDCSAYVLRIAGKDTALLGIDRYVEHEASLAAAAVGVGTRGRRVRRAGGIPRHPVHRGLEDRARWSR